MPSAAYENIMKRLGQSGRDYYDGFSGDDFVGLKQSEISDVQDRLLERARKGDGVALDGLRKLLSPDQYFALAYALISEHNVGTLLQAQAIVSICDICGDSRQDIWNHFLDCLVQSDLAARRFILGKVSELTPPPEIYEGIAGYLSGLIRTESNPTMLMLESGALLRFAGFAPQTAEYIEFARRLQNLNQVDREAAISEIMQRF